MITEHSRNYYVAAGPFVASGEPVENGISRGDNWCWQLQEISH